MLPKDLIVHVLTFMKEREFHIFFSNFSLVRKHIDVSISKNRGLKYDIDIDLVFDKNEVYIKILRQIISTTIKTYDKIDRNITLKSSMFLLILKHFRNLKYDLNQEMVMDRVGRVLQYPLNQMMPPLRHSPNKIMGILYSLFIKMLEQPAYLHCSRTQYYIADIEEIMAVVQWYDYFKRKVDK